MPRWRTRPADPHARGVRNDPASTATALLTRVGGPADITAVAHCMTRLRLTLADPAAADEEGLRALPGVLGLVSDGPTCQIVIGPGVVDEITAEVEARVTAGRQAVDGPSRRRRSSWPRLPDPSGPLRYGSQGDRQTSV